MNKIGNCKLNPKSIPNPSFKSAEQQHPLRGGTNWRQFSFILRPRKLSPKISSVEKLQNGDHYVDATGIIRWMRQVFWCFCPESKEDGLEPVVISKCYFDFFSFSGEKMTHGSVFTEEWQCFPMAHSKNPMVHIGKIVQYVTHIF